MSALITLTRTQTRVFLREPVVVVCGVAFPAALLLIVTVAALAVVHAQTPSAAQLRRTCDSGHQGWAPCDP